MSKRLWHYTDAQGLVGIISSSQLRFGDVQCLNDRTELGLGIRFLEWFLSIESSDEYAHIIAEARRIFRSSPDPRLFVCSFSEVVDSLSQWQRYGADGWGYSIGFDADELDAVLGSRVYRRKMCYNEDEQEKVARERFRQFALDIAQYSKRKKAALSRPELFRGLFNDLIIELKHPFFSDECEWRYITTLDTRSDGSIPAPVEQYAVRGAYVKPFVLLPSDNSRVLPIDVILSGPRLDAQLASRGTEQLLRAYGYQNVHVISSSLSGIWR